MSGTSTAKAAASTESSWLKKSFESVTFFLSNERHISNKNYSYFTQNLSTCLIISLGLVENTLSSLKAETYPNLLIFFLRNELIICCSWWLRFLLQYKVLLYSLDGRCLARYSAYDLALGVKSLAWSPSSQFLSLGSFDKKVSLFNVSMNQAYFLVIMKMVIY